MKSAEQDPLVSSEDFFRKLMGSEAEATLADFLDLWQSSDGLRRQIKQIVDNDRIASAPRGFIEESHPTIKNSDDNEISRYKLDVPAIASQVEKRLAQSYGGLCRKDLLILLDQYKAGKRDLGAYLLVRAWKRHASINNSPDVRLKRLTLDFFKRAITENRADYFRNIADVLEFLQDEEFKENGRWNHDPGQFWQFHLLLYVFEHPREKYAMRELVAHFEHEVGVNEMPTTKTIRAFCRANGITLDSTPGAPKKV